MLSMTHITRRFGATAALTEVSLEVHAGECLALLGENGAGKSTLMKILSGALAPDSGSMTFNGKPYAPGNPREGHRAGIAMIYQELNIAPELSVEDNIMLGQERRCCGLLDRKSHKRQIAPVLELLGHPNLPLHLPAGQLSIGLQQLVEIARALVSKARLVIFDEPTSSLTAEDTRRLFEVIRRLRESGLAIIYISHFLEEVRQVCDTYAVLRDGQLTGHGRLHEIETPQLISLMVGRDLDELFPVVPHQLGEPLLEVNQLSGVRFPRQATFNIRRGEIFGLAGLVGSGRTELMRTIYSLDPVTRGTVKIAKFTPAPSPRARILAGFGYLSEDRKQEGLAQAQSYVDNLTLSRLSPYSTCGILHRRKRDRAAEHWIRELQVKANSIHQPVSALSGGNQQKVALARVLHQRAEILLLDEPTRGIDVGTKAEIYRLIGTAAASGKGILFISSYLPELLAVCDTIGVMSQGALRAVRPAREWTEDAILTVALSSSNATDDIDSRSHS